MQINSNKLSSFWYSRNYFAKTSSLKRSHHWWLNAFMTSFMGGPFCTTVLYYIIWAFTRCLKSPITSSFNEYAITRRICHSLFSFRFSATLSTHLILRFRTAIFRWHFSSLTQNAEADMLILFGRQRQRHFAPKLN